MKFLLDTKADHVAARVQEYPDLVEGQLLTPLTRYYVGDMPFAIDNGAYSRLDLPALERLVVRTLPARDQLLFVTMPDAVGDHLRTIGLWYEHAAIFASLPKAFVVQDGFEGNVPEEASWVFIGGSTRFKDSPQVLNLVRRFKDEGRGVHVGRVNTPARFLAFRHAGADTCDGSGVSRFAKDFNKIRDGVQAHSKRQFLF